MVQPSKAPTSGSWASTVRGPDLDASIFQIGSDPTTEQRATSQSTRIGLVNQRFFPFPQRRTEIRMTLSIERAPQPLSPPTIAQSMPARSILPRSSSNGSIERKRTVAGASRSASILGALRPIRLPNQTHQPLLGVVERDAVFSTADSVKVVAQPLGNLVARNLAVFVHVEFFQQLLEPVFA
jgi:hypothetical protein